MTKCIWKVCELRIEVIKLLNISLMLKLNTNAISLYFRFDSVCATAYRLGPGHHRNMRPMSIEPESPEVQFLKKIAKSGLISGQMFDP